MIRRRTALRARETASSGRQALATLAAVALLELLVPPAAQAAPKQSLRAAVADIEDLARGLSVRFKTQAASRQQLAEHRLVDAQVLYNLKDYTRAAILLLDYINKYEGTRGYPEAVFYLADSLYHKRDFLSARRFFRMIVERIKGKYYQESLQRLVELSLRTGDSSHVEDYLRLLSNIPQNQLKPSVPYVRGKYYFFKRRTDQAIQAFSQIRTTNRYYMHARYFIGASYVRKKNYAAALKTFQQLLRTQPKSSGQKHIRQLSHLAIGRLLYHKGKVSQAIDQYQKVSRRSKEFDAALYEIAWAYVKAKKFKKALRALDLLVLAQPDSPFVPEVKVLQGNLLIRLKDWGRATDLFTKTRDKFVPVHRRMKQLLDEHSDPNVFFDVLLARNLGGTLAVQVKVPNLALHWVKEKPKVKRALRLVKDIREINKSIEDSKKLIARLENTLNSPAKIKIFPEFATARRHAVEVENKTAHTKRRVLARERKLALSAASGDERSQLDTLASERAGIERKVGALPTNVEGFKKRTQRQLKRVHRLARRLSKLELVVQNLKAQLVAAEKYFADSQAAKKEAVAASFRKEAKAMRERIEGLDSEVDDLKNQVADARDTVGVGGAREVEERKLKDRYRQLVAEEHKLLLSIRSRLGGQAGSQFDELAQLMARLERVDNKLQSFSKRLDSSVEGKLSSIRGVIREEKELMSKYEVEAADYKTQSDDVAGNITYNGFRQVTKRFYEIVVRSDVGIIDVAWALKDTKTKEVSRLVRQRKMDLKLLDDEFKEVLKEN